jgi:endonuclease/exonuclease/phosphatase (EEP) superfamily protein YafD
MLLMALPVSETRRERGTTTTASRSSSIFWRLLAGVPAALYPLALLVTIGAFRWVGERWWVTTVALYLPRIGFALPLPLLIIALWATGARAGIWLLLGTSVPILLVLMGLVLPWPVGIDPAKPSLRVMSYNVNSEASGSDGIVQEIDHFSPDVLLLEEHGASDKIVTLLQGRYPTVREAGQFVIATRFPVTSSFDPEKLRYSGRLRSPRWLEELIETPLGAIAFYVVHPQSPRQGFYALRGHGLKREILSGQGFPDDSEDVVADNTGLRTIQVADFASAARQETGPVVIAGDTNLPDLSYVLHRYLGGFQDGFTKAGWGFGYTFPVGRHGKWMRIDRILASSELRFVHFEVGRSLASDHACVVADLQRAP